MLLFHAVFASAAAATSASFLLPAGSCLAQRSGYICPPKKIHYPFMLVWKHRRYYYFRI